MSLWNGRRAALSLTFDDTLPCQLQNAVPEMDRRGIQGTFFAIADCREYPLDVVGWRKIVPAGHEIGSHSVAHRKAADLTLQNAMYEAQESKRQLENHFGTPMESFCYPYTDAPSHLQLAVKKFYKQARGGRGARVEKYVTPGDGVNLYNMPCFHVNEAAAGSVGRWADEALRRGAWLTLMFHGVGEPKAWDNVTSPTFCDMLDELVEAKGRGLWVAPFGAVAESYRKGI